MTDDTINSIRAVINEKSFSRAAKKLGVSQPAISAQVRKAEDELKITIFDRSAHPMRLTPEGEALSEYLDQKEKLEKNFLEKIRSMGNLESGLLRVGGASAFNFAFIPGMINRFSKLYPGVDIQVVDGSIAELRRKVLDGELDLFISSPTDLTEGLHFEPLFETKIYLCLPPRAPLTQALKEAEVPYEKLDDPQDWRETDFYMLKPAAEDAGYDLEKSLPFIRLSPDKNLGRMLDRLLERDGVTGRIAVTADQAVTAYMMTVNGLGACLMSGIDIKNIPLKEQPHFFMPDNHICRRTMYMVWKENTVLPPAAKEFARLLRESAGDM